MSLGPVLSLLAILIGSYVIAAIVRMVEDVPWKTVTIAVMATVAFLLQPILSGGIPVPLDEVARGYPYRGLFDVSDSLNPDANDTAKQMLPWMQAVREELFAGRAPLWNRWAFSGYPLLGNAQSAPFYPLFLATLWVPLPDQIVAMAGLKIFVALFFGFLLIRREGVSDGAALFGSAVFALSIFVSVYLYYPLASTVVLVPAAAWAILRCLDRPRFSSVMAVALVIGALQAAGHPETVFHAAVVVGMLLAIDLATPSERRDRSAIFRGAMTIAAGVVAGMLLSAPAWLPVLEQVLGSQRVREIEAGGFAGATYPFGILWIYLNPSGYGHPVRETWSWIAIYPMVASSYLGLLTLSLLPASVASRRSALRDRLLVAGGVLLTLIAMNWTVVGRIFVDLFPWIAHDRLRFGAVLLFGMAAARVVDRMMRGEWALPLAGASAAAFGAIYVLVRKWGVTLELRDTFGLAAVGLFWIVVVIVRRSKQGRSAVIGWTAFAVTVVELTTFGTEYNPPVSRRFYAPELPIIRAIEQAAPEGPFRIVGTDWMFLPNGAAHYGLEDVRGSDPMAWSPYTEFLEGFDVDDGETDIQRVSDLAAPQLDFLNVGFALSAPGWSAVPGWTPIYEGPDGIAWRNMEALPRAYMPEWVEIVPSSADGERLDAIDDFAQRVLMSGEEPHMVANEGASDLWVGMMSPTSYRIRVEPWEGDRFIATSIPGVAGWAIESEGRDIRSETVNGAFIGFWLPGGAETARIRYRPVVWQWSLVSCVLGFVLLLLMARGRMGDRGNRVRLE